MADYQLTPDGSVLRLADNAFIPADEANIDWQAFLAWQAEGNTPDPVPAQADQGKPQQITATQFLNRIPQQVLPVLYANPQTGVMLITLAAANMIDLTDPAVQGGINALVPNILTADQASAILDH